MNNVKHPDHYGGEDNPYEVIKVAEAWGLDQDAYLFNALKYVGRAGKKSPSKFVEDLEKAVFYLQRRINRTTHPQGEASTCYDCSATYNTAQFASCPECNPITCTVR